MSALDAAVARRGRALVGLLPRPVGALYLAVASALRPSYAAWIEQAERAEPEAVDRAFGAAFAPLHFAVQEFQPEVVSALLDAGATVDIVNRHGSSPLWTAVMHSDGRTEIVVRLLAAGADADLANGAGISPRDLVVDSPPDALRDLF